MIYASQYGAKLDSNLMHGGGSDDTVALQSILDLAKDRERLTVILDGAARISAPLIVYSNTTIICPSGNCGIYLSDNSNCYIIQNAHPCMTDIVDENITLIGGTYNHNGAHQNRFLDSPTVPDTFPLYSISVTLSFYGIKNLLIKDVTLMNQHAYATFFSNWNNVTIQNVHIDLRDHMDGEIQDGLHFHGPGRFLTIRDVQGNTGDDFIAILPDEHDFVSSIEDVVIDGVQLNGSDQGIRLLTRGTGRLDRISIRNVIGTYRSYGFSIKPWYPGRAGGNFGSISIDQVDLRALKNNYDYAKPFLFKIGGNIESLSLSNIHHHVPDNNRRLIEIGGNYIVDFDTPMDDEIVRAVFEEHRRDIQETEARAKLGRELAPTNIAYLSIDRLTIYENNMSALQDAYIRNRGNIAFFRITDPTVIRFLDDNSPKGVLVKNEDPGKIRQLSIQHAMGNGLAAWVQSAADDLGHYGFSSVDNAIARQIE